MIPLYDTFVFLFLGFFPAGDVVVVVVVVVAAAVGVGVILGGEGGGRRLVEALMLLLWPCLDTCSLYSSRICWSLS